jgi:hypothetical protein
MNFFLFLTQLFVCLFTFSQNNSQLRKIDSSAYAIKISSLEYDLCKLHNCQKENETSMLIALSFFPELNGRKITFKQRKIKTTLNARPTITSLLFSKKSKRAYVIRINKNKSDSIISLSTIPFNAKIGLFAHEFSHFLDYQSLSLFGILGRGISYSSKKSKSKFEKEIDLQTINRGLGWQLYDWSNYVQTESNATFNYKQFKLTTYMSPMEIEKHIDQLSVQ